LPGWQAVQEKLRDENIVIIAAAQDSGGEAVAGEWYDNAKASYVTLVDENHTVSNIFNLVNVPSAVWIDETGKVVRIDEGAYSKMYKTDDFEFGRDDYVPMIVDWVAKGAESQYASGVALPELTLSNDQALAEANFKLGVYFKKSGNTDKAQKYWQAAQALQTENWNYHRQDWSFGSAEKAGANWLKKFQSLDGEPYYRPITDLDN
jgi:hypothetical protein